ncbi:hypothetical protein PPERSA_02539 [Pseudocohnilembus persalinus]|uniref:Uncharacterized protein n=1 Tax=Pseudocohnilembus persalinus TaxID=266149 RepID=A0A0V0R5B2_PSEPJ|nr:hypothetical protein PPERSA_02539 [Pseudocohnilembus persalinus]|eukprot:KRX09667.1 hypothetical protein PPERSA_02539 [Pseudocohnilembus persalinus]
MAHNNSSNSGKYNNSQAISNIHIQEIPTTRTQQHFQIEETDDLIAQIRSKIYKNNKKNDKIPNVQKQQSAQKQNSPQKINEKTNPIENISQSYISVLQTTPQHDIEGNDDLQKKQQQENQPNQNNEKSEVQKLKKEFQLLKEQKNQKQILNYNQIDSETQEDIQPQNKNLKKQNFKENFKKLKQMYKEQIYEDFDKEDNYSKFNNKNSENVNEIQQRDKNQYQIENDDDNFVVKKNNSVTNLDNISQSENNG